MTLLRSLSATQEHEAITRLDGEHSKSGVHYSETPIGIKGQTTFTMKEGRRISNAIGLSLAPRVPQDFVVQLLKLHCADEGLNGLVSLATLLN